ncbi:hypothetical protein [Phyllobacterium sp. 21LDTY02-6]|uniref:hypothetical protein n=1 Tax=Phyllobacterium sp. 21LDTY02-6 TaxID=2944903 RepID=UPI0035319672
MSGDAFYVGKLGFELKEDTRLSPETRWVVVGPKGGQASPLLAKAVGEHQIATIGQQGGGRIAIMLDILQQGSLSTSSQEQSLTGRLPFLKTYTATAAI